VDNGVLGILVEKVADGLRNRLDSPLLGGANVVNIPDRALVENLIKCTSNVLHIQVAARVGAVAMDGQLAALLRQEHKFGDELLGVLLWSIHIVSSRGYHWELVRGVVRLHKHLCTSFGGCVGIGRLQWMVLLVPICQTY